MRRVADRVRAGGHAIEADDIRRRYARSLDNLVEAAELFDEIVVFENSHDPVQVASFGNGLPRVYHETPLTRRLRERLGAP